MFYLFRTINNAIRIHHPTASNQNCDIIYEDSIGVVTKTTQHYVFYLADSGVPSRWKHYYINLILVIEDACLNESDEE